MPAWISVYCRKPVSDVTGAELLAGIRDADYWTLAEQYDLSEDFVDAALDSLRIEAIAAGANNPAIFQLHYRPDGGRPLAIHRWDSPERVREEIGEALEQLADDRTAGIRAIREHLNGTVTVVAIELGFSQFEDMGIVFALEVARWIAERAYGVIKDDNDIWCRVKHGALRQF